MPFCREKAKGCRFFFKHIKFEILMIYRERKREREREGEREGWWQGGLNMMQTIWSGEWRLPAQPALFKLERKWPYIQHASKLPLPHCLSLSLLSLQLSFSLTHTKSLSFRSSRECERTRTYTLTCTEVKWWPLVRESVCYSNIMFLYITVTRPITVIIIITIITIWKAGGYTAEQE